MKEGSSGKRGATFGFHGALLIAVDVGLIEELEVLDLCSNISMNLISSM